MFRFSLPVPKGWTITVRDPEWHFGPFGYHWLKEKRIEIYPAAWIPRWFGLRRWWINMTITHELCHAWGIRRCGKPWCLVFEAAAWKEGWKDVWWEKVLAMIFLPFNGFRPCRSHRKFLENRISCNE